jgi:hypothetical protein
MSDQSRIVPNMGRPTWRRLRGSSTALCATTKPTLSTTRSWPARLHKRTDARPTTALPVNCCISVHRQSTLHRGLHQNRFGTLSDQSCINGPKTVRFPTKRPTLWTRPYRRWAFFATPFARCTRDDYFCIFPFSRKSVTVTTIPLPRHHQQYTVKS